MRIDWIKVHSFKNLKDFHIDFNEKRLTTVLIGINGSGKSNLIEALALIFRELDINNENTPPFEFSIRYQCRGRTIAIRTPVYRSISESIWRGYKISVSTEREDCAISWAQFKANRALYLPAHVFAYYSGPGERLRSYFVKHQKKFYSDIINDDSGRAPTLRRLFYCLPEHSQFVLLAYFFQTEGLPSFLREFFDIESFDSALLVLHKPWWADRQSRGAQERGDARFWNARGLVKTFLQKVWTEALAPIYETATVEDDFRDKPKPEERLYLYIKDLDTLRRLTSEWTTASGFFASLESSYISDLTRDVRIWIKRGSDTVPFAELSEGEKQLLTVVGLLRFTRTEESLFLLDEPDTHLNPRWKLRYLEVLSNEVGSLENSQMIISTHDPLTIAGLESNQVQIFEREEGRIHTRQPDVDPRGLGVSGVLIRMFGLPSTLDLETQRKINMRNELAAKRDRTEVDEKAMVDLSRELANLGLTYEARDPQYQRFLDELHHWESKQRQTASSLPTAEQAQIVDRILNNMFGINEP
ncbi:AAA family ATPase [Corallococcus exiguus]|uniref:AAA family ATPase n=1 Tax=Corallococcus exiguus TaxID=83462 RepID=UPI0015611BDF|nr:ATP-binding protein [Corallococcus exiguus]NRD55708.1 AAA family ATPase [Corallococcus exiguus]